MEGQARKQRRLGDGVELGDGAWKADELRRGARRVQQVLLGDAGPAWKCEKRKAHRFTGADRAVGEAV